VCLLQSGARILNCYEQADAGIIAFSDRSLESRRAKVEVSDLTYVRILEGKALCASAVGAT